MTVLLHAACLTSPSDRSSQGNRAGWGLKGGGGANAAAGGGGGGGGSWGCSVAGLSASVPSPPLLLLLLLSLMLLILLIMLSIILLLLMLEALARRRGASSIFHVVHCDGARVDWRCSSSNTVDAQAAPAASAVHTALRREEDGLLVRPLIILSEPSVDPWVP
jgi:hypothetical protein